MMCGDMWSMVQFTGRYEWLASTPIAYREMAAVVWCLHSFVEQCQGRQVAMQIDNMAICFSVNQGKSKNPKIMGLIRVLYHLTSIYHVQYVDFHLSSAANDGADALSRGLVTKYHELYPN